MDTTSEVKIPDADTSLPDMPGQKSIASYAIQPNNGKAKRRDLVGLLRGYFASPVIATLGEMGMTGRMLEGEFSAADFDSIPRMDVAQSLFRYMRSIGLLEEGIAAEYALTSQGRTIISRNGAFSLLMSYAEYFHQLPSLLAGTEQKPSVNRLRNVRGSGELHSKKFFPAAFDFFLSNPPTAIIDIGCGDGCFLSHARKKWSELPVFGVDLSETAVEATRHRLNVSCSPSSVAMTADGFDVTRWSQAVPQFIQTSPRLIISAWFVAHEFSSGSPEKITDFFSALRNKFPRAQIVLGEINKISPDVLAEDHELSIMPEFLLFHELSGQGVLSWAVWNDILKNIPYILANEQRFDEVRAGAGERVPASFLWLLEPK